MLMINMVLTRGMTASSSTTRRHYDYDYTSSEHSDDSSDSDTTFTSADTSDTESDYTSDSFSVFDCELYHEFEIALREDDWTESRFHDLIANEFFVNRCNISWEWIAFIKESILNYDTDDYRPYINEFLSIENLPERFVQKCSICQEFRTISKAISFNGSNDPYYAGKNCANKIQTITNFYISMLDHMKHPHADHRVTLRSIWGWLADNFELEE